MEIDFEDVIMKIGAELRRRSGNLKCPFCGKMSFKVYNDAKAKCHNASCGWSGNAIKLYSDYKKITYQEAFAELTGLYKAGEINLRKRTYAEAKAKLADDLEFLAECRMYLAFYGRDRSSQTDIQKMSGLSKAVFSKVLDGKLDEVGVESWWKVILILKEKINLKQFRQDRLDKDYFVRMIEERMKDAVKKLMG